MEIENFCSLIYVLSQGNPSVLVSILASNKILENQLDLDKIVQAMKKNRIDLNDVDKFINPKHFKYYNEIKKSRHLVKLDLPKQQILDVNLTRNESKKNSSIFETIPLKTEQGSSYKSDTPHFWLEINVSFEKINKFAKENFSENEIGVSSLLLKAAANCLLRHPSFYQFRANEKFYKSDELWIEYIDLSDQKLNRIVKIQKGMILSKTESPKNIDGLPNFKIIDARNTDVGFLLPVLEKNTV